MLQKEITTHSDTMEDDFDLIIEDINNNKIISLSITNLDNDKLKKIRDVLKDNISLKKLAVFLDKTDEANREELDSVLESLILNLSRKTNIKSLITYDFMYNYKSIDDHLFGKIFIPLQCNLSLTDIQTYVFAGELDVYINFEKCMKDVETRNSVEYEPLIDYLSHINVLKQLNKELANKEIEINRCQNIPVKSSLNDQYNKLSKNFGDLENYANFLLSMLNPQIIKDAFDIVSQDNNPELRNELQDLMHQKYLQVKNLDKTFGIYLNRLPKEALFPIISCVISNECIKPDFKPKLEIIYDPYANYAQSVPIVKTFIEQVYDAECQAVNLLSNFTVPLIGLLYGFTHSHIMRDENLEMMPLITTTLAMTCFNNLFNKALALFDPTHKFFKFIGMPCQAFAYGILSPYLTFKTFDNIESSYTPNSHSDTVISGILTFINSTICPLAAFVANKVLPQDSKIARSRN